MPELDDEVARLLRQAWEPLLAAQPAPKTDPWPERVQPAPLAKAKPTRRAPRTRVRFATYSAGPNRYTGRPGTWTSYMVRTILAHTDTATASAAHRISGEHPDKALDFAWCASKGYITL